MSAGVDVILDCVGGAYLSKNIDCLAFDGRLFIIGLQGGPKGELPLHSILFKRLTVTGTFADTMIHSLWKITKLPEFSDLPLLLILEGRSSPYLDSCFFITI